MKKEVVTDTIPFSKWHALGNDFLLMDGLLYPLPWEVYAPFFCHRQFGVGCDQLLVREKGEKAPVKMKIYNRDGSTAEMCGNGIRAFHAWLQKQKVAGSVLQVETDGGVYTVEERDGVYRVCMGVPSFSVSDFSSSEKIFSRREGIYGENWPEEVRFLKNFFVSIGNPHLVFFVEDSTRIPLEEWGPKIEHSSLFPSRINVEFVRVLSPFEIVVSVWERGAGATLACGTGATASVVAGVEKKILTPPVKVHLPGGTVTIDKVGEEYFLSGEVTWVADGVVHLSAYEAFRNFKEKRYV